MNWKVPLADLNYGPEEEEAVLRVLRSKWLTMGAETQLFEEEFARSHGVEHAIAVSNCTQALHLACLVLDIGEGDEVIVPSLSFVATSNAVRYTGARVRFADILSPQEPTIDPAAVESLVTPRTKAVIVMHYGGYPCRMPEIMEVAAKHRLMVIEDTAHAPGAWLQGKALGNWGDVGCFSFFSNKNLATGEGGMITTRDAKLDLRLRLMRSHGMTTLTWDRHRGHAYSYDVVAPGYNDRIDEIRAALGREQLKKLGEANNKRLEIIRTYREAFAHNGCDIPFKHIEWEPDSRDYLPSGHLMPILLPRGYERQHFVDMLKLAAIQTSLHYPPIHTFSAYKAEQPETCLEQTEAYAAREVTLPLFPGMTREQLEYTIDVVNRSL